MFEDVSWFGEEAEPMAYTGRQPFLCSGVRVVHCAGTSFCHVYFYIEVTGPDSPARIREENAVAAALKERFPKMRLENSYCLWSPEEAAGIAAANEALAPKLEEVKQSLPPFREQIWRENAETVRAFMEHCLLLAERAEAALDQPLYDCFGASPDWWLAD